MTCNLSSYQILTNSILFHWLLFVSIDHRRRHAISFVISTTVLFYECSHFVFSAWLVLFLRLFFLRWGAWACVYIMLLLVFFLFFFTFFMHVILLVWNYILDVRFAFVCFIFFLLLSSFFVQGGTSAEKPMVKPNKLQQLFMFLLRVYDFFFSHSFLSLLVFFLFAFRTLVI